MKLIKPAALLSVFILAACDDGPETIGQTEPSTFAFEGGAPIANEPPDATTLPESGDAIPAPAPGAESQDFDGLNGDSDVEQAGERG
jgi:hypothetical protein